MKSRITFTLLACALGLPAAAYAGLSKQERNAEQQRISAEYKSALKNCARKNGNTRDICMAEAKGAENVARAELEARDKGTAKAGAAARMARADAEYAVAKENCDDLAGNAKDVCLKDAQAAAIRARADARTERRTEEANKTANEKVAEARRDAAAIKRQADYNAARERCDSLSGGAKDRCLADARAKHGMK
ncbi:MAG: hypothetical protein AABZ67_05550 [Pseudomonadota bacterium]